jgi:hypothetical protein
MWITNTHWILHYRAHALTKVAHLFFPITFVLSFPTHCVHVTVKAHDTIPTHHVVAKALVSKL